MVARVLSGIGLADCERLRAELVRRGAFGCRHAVPRRELVGVVGSDRRLRAIMSEAPGLGVAIGSSGSGYFVIGAPEDADRCILELRSRISELGRRACELEAIRRDLAAAAFGGRLF